MVGDVLTSTIICQNLKKFILDIEVHYAVYSHTVPVILNNPYIDEIIEFKPEYRKNKLKFFNFLRALRAKNYDVVIDNYGKIESFLMTIFSEAELKIGIQKSYTNLIYTKTFAPVKKPFKNSGFAIDNRLQLLKPLLPDIPYKELVSKPIIHLKETEKALAREFFFDNGIESSKTLFMISVLGSSIEKSYPPAYMARLLDAIINQLPDAILLFNYIPSQKIEAMEIYELCQEITQKQIRPEVFAPSLRSFLGILSQCDAIIGNEGGSINMAKALEVPTFSIFAPWIRKESWGFFEDEKNKSVHLKEFKPELFKGKNTKDLKNSTQKLYQDFKPELFEQEFLIFIEKL